MSIEIKSDILAKELNQGIVPLGVPKAYQYDAALVEAARAAVNQGLDSVKAQESTSTTNINTLGDKILAQMKHGYGYPFTAASAAAMTDTTKIYVYTGSETGYTNGNWYYWNGTAWVSGGVYNSMALETDKTLTVSGAAADAKVVGFVRDVSGYNNNTTYTFGNINFDNKNTVVGKPSVGSYVVRLTAFDKLSESKKYKLNTIKLKVGNYTSGNIRFYVAELGNDGVTATVVGTFVMPLINGEHEYQNGVDFVYDEYVKSNTLIGIRVDGVTTTGAVYYGDSNLESSYAYTGDFNSNTIGTYTLGKNTYGIALAGTIVDVTDDIETANIEQLASDTWLMGNKDFSKMENVTSYGHAMIYFVSQSVPFDSMLDTLYLKCKDDINNRLYVGVLENGNLKVIDTFMVNCTASKTEYKNGVDFFYNAVLPANSIIGIRLGMTSQNQLYYYFNNTFVASIQVEGDLYSYVGTNTNVPYGYGKPDFSMGYTIKTNAYTDAVKDSVRQSTGINTGRLIPPSTETYMDSNNYVLKIKPSTLTGTKILTKKLPKESTDLAVCQIAFVDFSANTIGFYNRSSTGQTLSVYQSKTVGFPFVAGHEYVVEHIREDNYKATIRITDAFTFDTDELSVDYFAVGTGWGICSYEYYVNNVSQSVMSEKLYSSQEYGCKVLIIGDSFIEGSSLYGVNPEYVKKRYAYLIKEAINGSCYINGQGGARSAEGNVWLNEYLSDCVMPKYCIVAFGMNDPNFSAWLTNTVGILKTLEAKSIRPILVTVTPNPLDREWRDINSWIRNSGYDYIDANIVTSVNYDGVTENTNYFLSDLIHPNVAGHQIIFQRAKLDVPYLFE